MAIQRSSPVSARLLAALWFGVVAGLVEGLGLLAFQRINWARWGPMMHVSWEILWISPLVDCAFFLVVAGLLSLILRLAPRVRALTVIVFVLTYLTVYDWLTLTARLQRLACILLAVGVAAAFSRWLANHEGRALRFWRGSTAWLVIVAILVFAGVQGGKWWHEQRTVAELPPSKPGSPNVVVIVVDTLRADHVSSYGYDRPTTPEIDHLASQGVLFENAIAPSSWSLPSHASLVTGRYVHEHGVGNVEPEPWLGWGANSLGGWPTLGGALERRGYRTGAFSANRTYFSRDLGFGRGFLHFEDYFSSPSDCFVRTLFGREFDRIYLKRTDKSLVKRALRRVLPVAMFDQDAEGSGSYGGAFGVRKRADVVNREVLQWVNRDHQYPFLAFLNYFDVHDPYGGPPGYAKPAWEQNTDIDRYDDGVKYVDDHIRALMDGLQQRGLLKNTLVIVTSDHGESLGQHHLETHGRALYWELVHVPLVVWFPGHVPAGVKISAPVSNAAIPATVLDLLGANWQNTFPAPSLVAAWQSQDEDQTLSLPDPLSEIVQNNYEGKHDAAADRLIPTAATGWMKSLVTPQVQFIVHQKLGEQIYDWRQDPGELHDLNQTSEGQEAASDLERRMQSALAERPPGKPSAR
jgi:arylsulfatase A-like enzyme